MKVASIETYHLKKNVEELQQELETLRKKNAQLEYESVKLKKQNDHVYFLEQLLTLIPEHIYWKNAHSVYLGCNDKFAQMFGLTSREQVIGKSEYELNNGANAHSTIVHDQTVIKNNQATFVEEAANDHQGQQRFFLSHKVPVTNQYGTVIGLIGISFDITQRKKIETELQIAQEKAETANELKTEIIRNFSHDIRTPLSGIISMADILAKHSPKIASELHDIKNASEQLLNLLSEIITVSQIELNELPDNQEKFSLRALVDNTMSLFKPAIYEKNLTYTLMYDEKIPHYLLGNTTFLKKILLNLIGNAIKFTDSGSVNVGVDCLRKDDGKLLVQLIVEDTGIGIPDDKQAWIFEPFNRLTPAYQGQYKGSGLGLHIVSEFIRKLDGEIYVKSTLGKGSTFKCLIPLKRTLLEHREDDLPEAIVPKSTLGLNVLLVEDNLLAQKTAAIKLKQWGYDVLVASNGQEAILISKTQLFDLIYMDLGLPDQSGCHVTQAIRQDSNNPNYKTIIIALTAHADEKIHEACKAVGMQTVLSKPLMDNKIQEVFEQYFKIKSNTIDLIMGAKLIDGNDAAAKEILALLAKGLPDDEQLMMGAYEKKDYDALKKHVHKLHGGLCYCGAPALRDAAKNLEIALNNKANDLEDKFTHLINEIKIFRQTWALMN